MSFGIHKETLHYIEFSGGAAVVTAGTTSYAPVGSATTYSATELQRQTIAPRTMKVTGFTIVTGNSQPGSGSLVFTLRKNGVDTTLVCTIAAGSNAGSYISNTADISFSENDLISLKAVNNASGNSAGLVAWKFLIL